MKRILAILLILSLPLYSDDVVHLKDGKQVSGHVVEYEKYVELETSDGKVQKIEKDKIEKITFESRIIHCPEVLEFPDEEIQKGEWEFLGYRNVVIAAEKTPGNRFLGIDIKTGKRLWKLELAGREGTPVLFGSLLYLMKLDSYVDEKRKYKFQGAMHSKEVHRLTIFCIDPLTGKEAWNVALDNNDRTDMLWDFIKGDVSLHSAGTIVVARAVKSGSPIDKSGVLDKSVSKVYLTLSVIDPEKKKVVSSHDNDEGMKAAEFYFTEDLFIYQTSPALNLFNIHAFSLKEGRIQWKVDNSKARMLSTLGDALYLRDDTHLWAYSVKTGKKIEKWFVEHKGSELAGLDRNYLYIFRKNLYPKAIFGYDIRKAPVIEAFKIDMGNNEEFTFRVLIGKWLIYTDQKNALIAYDTLNKCEAWRLASAQGGAPSAFCRVGTALYFLKDGKVNMLDLATGRPVWNLVGDWMGILPLGDAGVLCAKRVGAELLRERDVPAKAVFLTPTGTPLRYQFTEPTFSRPASSGDSLYTMGSAGAIYCFSMKDKKLLYTAKMTDNPAEDPLPPFAHEGLWGVDLQGALHLYDAAKNAKISQVPHTVTGRYAPIVIIGEHMITSTNNGVGRFEWKTGRKVWESNGLYNVVGFAMSDDSIWAVDPTKAYRLDPGDGHVIKSIDCQPSGTQVNVESGQVIISGYGSWVGRLNVDEGGWKWIHKAANQDPSVALTFKGHMIVGGGLTYFTSADGRVAAFDSKTGEEKWSHVAPKYTSPLLLAGGKLYFVDRQEGLLTLDGKTGQVLSALPVPDPKRWTPVSLGSKSYFWTADGWLVEGD